MSENEQVHTEDLSSQSQEETTVAPDSESPEKEAKLQVVGVILDPSLACSLEVGQDETVDDIVRDFNALLVNGINSKTQNIIDPVQVTTVQVFIPAVVSTEGHTISESTFSSLIAQKPTDSYTIILGLSREQSIMDRLLERDRENLATAVAKLTINDKPANNSSGGSSHKKSGRRQPLAESSASNAPSDDNEAFIRTLKEDMAAFRARMLGFEASNAELKSSIATLQTSNSEQKVTISEQNDKIIKLQLSNTKLETSNARLEASNARLEASNARLETSNTRLEASCKELETLRDELRASNAQLSSTLRRQGTTLFALNRRMVIDDARVVIAKKYGFSMDTLRVGNSSQNSEEASSLTQRLDALVDHVHRVLDKSDTALLSKEALNMIFDPSPNSIRYQGNIAAHHAPSQDLADAVLGSDLTAGQRVLLENVHQFAYGFKPALV